MKKMLRMAASLGLALSMSASLAFFQLPSQTDLNDQFDLIAVRAIDGTGLTGIRNNYEIVDANRIFVYDEVISVCATVEIENWYKNPNNLRLGGNYELAITSDTIDFGWAYSENASVISQIYSKYLGAQNARIYGLKVECEGNVATIDLKGVRDTVSGNKDSVVFDYGWDGNTSATGANGIGAANEIVLLNGQYGPNSIQYHYVVNGITKAPATGTQGNVKAYLIAKSAEKFAAVSDQPYNAQMAISALNLSVRRYNVKNADVESNAMLKVFKDANMLRTEARDYSGNTISITPDYTLYELVDISGEKDVPLCVLVTETYDPYSYYLEQGIGLMAKASEDGDWLQAALSMSTLKVVQADGSMVAAVNDSKIQKTLSSLGMNLGLGDTKYVADSDFEKFGADAVLKSQVDGTYKYGTASIEDEEVNEPTEDEDVEEEGGEIEEELPEEEEDDDDKEVVVPTGDLSASAAAALISAALVAAGALALVVKKAR
jgi:hypothetical protein